MDGVSTAMKIDSTTTHPPYTPPPSPPLPHTPAPPTHTHTLSTHGPLSAAGWAFWAHGCAFWISARAVRGDGGDGKGNGRTGFGDEKTMAVGVRRRGWRMRLVGRKSEEGGACGGTGGGTLVHVIVAGRIEGGMGCVGRRKGGEEGG